LNADVADKTAQIENLNADVADKATQIEDLNADVADKTAQIENLNADIVDKDAKLNNLLLASAISPETDIAELSYDELIDLKVVISNAISAFENTAEGQEIWYDDNNVKITCVKYGLRMGYSSVELKFDFIIENNSEKSIWAGINSDFANGWAVGTHGNFCDNELQAGKKMKSTQTIYLKNCDINGFEDLAKYEFVFWVDLDEQSYSDDRLEFNREISVFPIY